MEELKKQVEKITSLEIQGATNIAKYGVKILSDYIKRQKYNSKQELIDDLHFSVDLIRNSRDTEPAMQNGLSYVYNRLVEIIKDADITKILDYIGKYSGEYIDILNESKKMIAKIGANRIPKHKKNLTIMTHCHSSVTTGILLEAHRQGKEFSVICTETRPRQQGYITAKELVEEGIDTTLIVDSAMRYALRNFDISFILIGADAITSEGTVLNKIGSRLLGLAAREMHVPMYVATPLLKFSMHTKFGNLEKIDMRSWKEVWPGKPDELKILNPAFETISRRYISGLITEAGIYPATSTALLFEKTYPYLVK